MLDLANSNRTLLAAAVAAALSSSPAAAQQQGTQKAKRTLSEITVTATRVEESLQDVPISVSAMSGEDIRELGITNFADYVMQLPSVTAGGSGPGQNTIYIRGIASTTPNLTTAGVAGLAPNVAFYLDEQPLSQPGRNLDVYAADLSRIEVLSGPQGTLFGASSQAGNVRLITNKPDLGDTYGSINVSAGAVTDGDTNTNIEAMMNVPISETFGLRGVVYYDRKGGWIDNVAGTIDASESARFRPEGTVRDNGVPVSAQRAGFQSTADLSGVTFLEADNSALVEKNINETDYTGGRLSARWTPTDRLQFDLAYATQDIDSDGVFFADPTLDGDYEIQRYSEDRIEDSFDNFAWTAEWLVNELELVYTGAYTDRETDQTIDYTDYLFVGQYLPYYICDGSVTYPGAAAPSGTCQPPNLFVDSTTETEVFTHEIRISSDQSKRFRVTAGVFYSDLELLEVNDFTYPGSVDAIAFNGETGFGPNYPLTNTAVTGEVGSAQAGFFSDPGPFPEGVIFRNDVLRTDEQLGFFGEASYDLNDKWSVTFGARVYDIEVDFQGSANSSFGNFGQTEDAQIFGTNISAQYAPNNAVGAPDKAVADGSIFKATVDWRPAPEALLYFTWSEGFRPGLLNRPGGAAGPNNFTVPFELDTDNVTNYEIGLKGDFADATLRFNGALFFVDIESLQTTIFDPSITNLFFSDNAADAEVTGFEGDFMWLPAFSEYFTLSGSFSFLDTEITKVITPTNDVREGDELAFAPEFQATLRARWEWDVNMGGRSWVAHVMPSLTHSSDSFSDIITINRDKIDGWTMLNVSAGISNDQWSLELFGSNVTDEQVEMARSFVFDRQRVTYAPPATWGVRAGLRF